MIKRSLISLSILIPLALVSACDRGQPTAVVEDRDRVPDITQEETDPYSAAMLETYKAALPKLSLLEAPSPQSDMQAQLGNPATYPAIAAPQVRAVNEQVRGLVDMLEAITALPPTVYNSDTLEFVWGPWENDDTALQGDNVLAYIKDNGAGADHRYSYAFVRGMGNDVATYQPVIWGAMNPGPDDDTGNGLVLFDFEANKLFEDAHNPSVSADLTRGRFAIAFGRGESDDGSGAMVTIVLSTFRDFLPDGQAGDVVDMDQLYGHVAGVDGNTVDFVSILAAADITPDDAANSALEDIDLRLAFLNGGLGRAEAIASGGDLTSDTGESVVLATECWDGLIARTYLDVAAEGEIAADMPDGRITIEREGEPELCGPIFNNTLADLSIPSIDDVDSALLEALENVAANGL